MDKEKKKLLQGYKKQIKIAPNHPYRFKLGSKDVVMGLALRAYHQAGEDVDVGFPTVNPVIFFMILTMLIMGMYIIFNPTLLEYLRGIQLQILSTFF